ncbi:hypothetical protein SISSUDRAFT_1127327 [Sistotremastrum suecicum HHB10207 ss-3]|uniref:F-box domain-containing protein n=1 Tax=Sistotremastrum suecicum HHB10207 ss-3 TaxID=1314776 RepID=A0A166F5D5_9AGAM|nr:hypothetical protein SISSUDRAFT_1127327 [Sistotremastrum suecicum HHB10207 ss-3]
MEVLMPPSLADSRAFVQDAEGHLRAVLSQTAHETSSLILCATVYPQLQPIDTSGKGGRDPLMSAALTLEGIQERFNATIGNQIAELKRHSNWRRPLLRLPDELLVHMFKFCFSDAEDEMNSDIDSPSQESYDIKIKLTHVCAAWRSVAISNRTFWSSIQMHWPMSKIDTFASRCYPAPLNIICPSSALAEPMKKVFVLTKLERMESLHVTVSDKRTADDFKFQCHPILRQAIPKMKALTLTFPEDLPGELDKDEEEEEELFDDEAHRLRNLTLINVKGDLDSPVFYQLTELHIRYANPRNYNEGPKEELKLIDVVALLQKSPNLEIFQFSVDYISTSLTAKDYFPDSTASKLHTLILDSWARPAIKSFFFRFSFPVLERIKVTTAPINAETEEEDTNMLSFLADAPYDVRTLLSTGCHLAIQGSLHENPESGTSFTLTPSSPSHRSHDSHSHSQPHSLIRSRPTVVLQPRAPDWGEQEDQGDWHSWVNWIYHTISLSRAYFPLSNLRSFAFNLNGPDYYVSEFPNEKRCWEIFFEACVSLEEVEILGLDTWKPMVRVLGQVRKARGSVSFQAGKNTASSPSPTCNVPCPSLRTLRLLMQSVPQDRESILLTTLRNRKSNGAMLRELIFIPYKARHSSESIDEYESRESRLALRILEEVVGCAKRVEMSASQGAVSILDGVRGFDLVDGERRICTTPPRREDDEE